MLIAPFGHVGEQRSWRARLQGWAVGAAQQASGWMPISRSFCTVCWVGLVLSSPAAAIRQVGQVHEGGVVGAELQAQLAHGFQEGQGLDVAHGAADFADGHIHFVVGANARRA
jgi:hypothetical protein